MKVFLQIFLYLNVSICALFFVIWFLTSFLFFESAVASSSDAKPTTNEGAVQENLDNTAVKSPSAQSAEESTPNGSKSSVGTMQKALLESPSDLQNSADNIPTPPPILENNSSPSVESDPVPSVPGNDPSSLESINDIAEQFPEDSSSLNEMLESNKQFHEDQGSNKKMVKDLMDLNRKVVEVYKMLSDYEYDTTDRRDPFTPFKGTEEQAAKESMLPLPTYPTGQYTISEMKLVGIKWGLKLNSSRALFRTPDNVLHRLQKNDWIGKNRGVIYQVREDEVVIVEPRLVDASSSSEEVYTPIVVRLERWKDKNNKK